MPYTFRIVDIHAFDVHTSLPPLLNAAVLHPDFNFLLNPPDYVKQHSGTAAFGAGGLTLSPLRSKKLDSSYFWRNCSRIWHGTSVDFWKLQIPFHCALPGMSIAFDSGLPKTTALAGSSVYLSSLGWSTTLHVRLFGAISPQDLLAVVRRFRTAASFTVANSTKSLSDIFREYSDTLRKNLYVPPSSVLDQATTHRHMVISIAKYDGQLACFSNPWTPGGVRMSDAERAQILSVLLGQQLNIAGLAAREAKPDFLLQHYSEFDFALTDFGMGTLLWMQSPRKKKRHAALWCLATNIAASSMYMLSLANFLKSTEQTPPTATTVKTLREAIQFTVSQLGNSYSNRFCRGFLRNQSVLMKFAG